MSYQEYSVLQQPSGRDVLVRVCERGGVPRRLRFHGLGSVGGIVPTKSTAMSAFSSEADVADLLDTLRDPKHR